MNAKPAVNAVLAVLLGAPQPRVGIAEDGKRVIGGPDLGALAEACVTVAYRAAADAIDCDCDSDMDICPIRNAATSLRELAARLEAGVR